MATEESKVRQVGQERKRTRSLALGIPTHPIPGVECHDSTRNLLDPDHRRPILRTLPYRLVSFGGTSLIIQPHIIATAR
jgi:hypothetical protein